MKKRRSRSPKTVGYDTLPYKRDGVPYTVFLCTRCSKAWKLRDPVEAWRIKTLLTHFESHRADSAIREMLGGDANPRLADGEE